MDRGAWWATVWGAYKESDTAERINTHTHTHYQIKIFNIKLQELR